MSEARQSDAHRAAGSHRALGSDVLDLLGPPPPTRPQVELLGAELRAAGTLDLRAFTRISDYVNMAGSFFELGDAALLRADGMPMGVRMPSLRVRLDDIEIVGQRGPEPTIVSEDRYVPKAPRSLIVMTATHLIQGSAHLHPQSTLVAFVDATEPRFMPMTDVTIRRVGDGASIGRYAFVLIHRRHVIGVAPGRDAAGAGERPPTHPPLEPAASR